MLRLTRFFRRLQAGLAIALLLSLGLVTATMAHPLTNGEFGAHPSPGCSLNGWAVNTAGNAGAAALTESAAGLSQSTNCVARLEAGSPGLSAARLGQEFHVPNVSGPVWLTVDLQLRSGGGSATSQAQFIGVFDGAGNPICSNWFNASTTAWGSWNCDVSVYKASEIYLQLRARVGSNDSHGWSKVFADRMRFGSDNTCSSNGGGSQTLVKTQRFGQRGGFSDLDSGGSWCW